MKEKIYIYIFFFRLSLVQPRQSLVTTPLLNTEEGEVRRWGSDRGVEGEDKEKEEEEEKHEYVEEEEKEEQEEEREKGRCGRNRLSVGTQCSQYSHLGRLSSLVTQIWYSKFSIFYTKQ